MTASPSITASPTPTPSDTGVCPFILSGEEDSYTIIDTAITHAYLKRMEQTTYHSTTALQSKDGYYELMLYGPSEDQFNINSLGLWVVDHPENTEVIADLFGNVHTTSQRLPVTAMDSYGNDVTDMLVEQDGDYWESDLTVKDLNDDASLYDWITLTLPDAPDAGVAKLIVDAKTSMLTDFKLWYSMHYILGTPNLWHTIDLMENDAELIPHFDQTAWLTTALHFQYWDGDTWVDFEESHPMPSVSSFFGHPMLVPINLSVVEDGQVRLLTPAGNHLFDYVAVDYSPDAAVTLSQLEPVEATLHINTDTDVDATKDVLGQISAVDDSYATFEIGSYINYRFEALDEPAKGLRRSFVMPVSGYWYILGPEVPEDRRDNLPLFAILAATPNAFTKVVLADYASSGPAYTIFARNRVLILLPEMLGTLKREQRYSYQVGGYWNQTGN